MLSRWPHIHISRPSSDVDEQILSILNNDVKRMIAINHGYLGLVRLDIEEDILSIDYLDEYINELNANYERIVSLLEVAQDLYHSKFEDNV